MTKVLRGILISCFGLLLTSQVNAQARQLRKTDSVFKLIKKHIYTKDADAIYDLADTRFRQSISQGVFRDFLFREVFSLGLIKKDSLVSFVNNVTAAYKIQYENAAFLLSLSLDDGDKLDLFKLEPYTEPVKNKKSLVPSTNSLKTKTDSVVDVVARKYIQKANTAGLSLGILKNGAISTYNYGETKRDNGQLPTVNTIFEIASISKTFTATLLAWYVNEGKLNLNDPITKYLPDSVAANPALKDIKLVNLSNHSSGLPGLPGNFSAQINYSDANPYRYYTREMLFGYLKNCTLRSTPGTKYAYSNLAVGLLGVILERVTGKPYEQLVTEIICKPLGMKSTEQHLNVQTAPRFVTVYNENGVPTPPWDFDALQACGSLKSTINDLLIYARANMTKSNSKLSKAFQLAHQITFNNGDSEVALGWHIIKVDGVSYIFHNGGTEGSSSFLAYNIEKGLVVVILSNSGASTDNTGVGIISKLQ
ncbi:serine hydrolase domain-containing protein [Mucilaginibacter sp. dw_454]|uniref:serine hydrolase domain-containing protein n=1 Tax=Mucilaginibacter sp. dw_454 TaxID=2720079 RepID=UPI001BD20EA7|nr:serine hydrolase domain-containing protein [Mucilaginibacter sp. dw_454]